MSCHCTVVEVAAFMWWVSTRPAGWTEAQHLEDPACFGLSVDEILARPHLTAEGMRLCYAIAWSVKEIRRQVREKGTEVPR